MNRPELLEDSTFILYLIPLILSGGYALVLWISAGFSAALPENVYLAVTKNPYVFLIGLVSVCVGALVEVYSSPRKTRLVKLGENSKRMQILAVVCVVTAIVFAWTTTGYSSNLAQALVTFLNGRYSIIYPVILLVMSFLISPSIRVKMSRGPGLRESVSIALVTASPLLIFGLWRLDSPWWQTLGLPFIILIAGISLSFLNLRSTVRSNNNDRPKSKAQ